jgi:hypothetical protein
MPQIPQKFGPYFQTVVLGASGSGQVSFQANGNNARITNLYVKVSTTVNQATCTIYKGTVSDSNVISSTNSGSSGSSFTGAIDLFDGETCFVVWTGGDVGATATATFVGNAVNFNELGSSQLVASDPIAAGDGSLIYPALKSPNYVAGVSGWKIDRNGSVEFADGTFRGDVQVSATTGGAYVAVQADAINAVIDINPPDVPGHTITPASLFGSSSATLTELTIFGPSIDGTGYAQIELIADLASNKTAMDMNIDVVNISCETFSIFGNGIVDMASNVSSVKLGTTAVTGVLSNNDGETYFRGRRGTSTVTVTASANTNLAVTFVPAFAVGVTPLVFCNLTNGPAGWNARALAPTNTGFSINLNTAGAAGTFSGNVQWIALIPTG